MPPPTVAADDARCATISVVNAVNAVNETIARIESALAAVQRTLDALTARGHEQAAFDVARLQFSASIRTSWPGNLAPLASALERVAADASLSLSDQERADARDAAATFRSLVS